MRAQLLAALGVRQVAAILIVITGVSASAQDSTPKDQKDTLRNLKVSGCIAPDTASAGHFTLTDYTSGTTTYRLTGIDVRRYLGKRVEVVGAAVESKLKIVGGLTPSPNVAGQAGAMDPTRAAMAAQGAEGNAQPGNIEVPEFRVKTVKAVVPDGCGQKP